MTARWKKSLSPANLTASGSSFQVSPYVLTWNDASAGSANTGESAVLIWIMTALCVLSLAAAGAVVYRKRKTAAE